MQSVTVTKMEDPKASSVAADDTSIDVDFDLNKAVTQRLAFLNKKTVQLNDLLSATKFTKQEICHMYRGFKQVSSVFSIQIMYLQHVLNRIYTNLLLSWFIFITYLNG